MATPITMYSFNSRVVLLLAFTLTGLPGFAGHDEEEAGPNFIETDTDGDGRISRAESIAGARRAFAAMDTNHDGYVVAAELDAYHAQRRDATVRAGVSTETEGPARDPGSGAARADGSVSPHEVANARGAESDISSTERIRRGDRNGDERLTVEEYGAVTDELFARADANGDGAVTRAESGLGRDKFLAKSH